MPDGLSMRHTMAAEVHYLHSEFSNYLCLISAYLIFVTGTTGGARGEFFCHVEKFVHMTVCQVEKFST